MEKIISFVMAGIKKAKRAKAEAESEEEPQPTAGSEDEEEDDEESVGSEDENEVDGGEGEQAAKKDGMAEMMSKILNQSVNSSNPVLAKRKTAIMKDMEESKEDHERLKRLRAQRKVDREKQIVIPDAGTADYESQLRKLATRGVVALFNAISTSKREEAEAKSAGAAKLAEEGKEISRVDVKRMTQANFRELLKGEESAAAAKSGDAIGATAPTNSSSSGSGAAKPSSAVANSKEKEKSWSALRDDYLLESSMKLKHWDKESDSDEDDGAVDRELDDAPLRSNTTR